MLLLLLLIFTTRRSVSEQTAVPLHWNGNEADSLSLFWSAVWSSLLSFTFSCIPTNQPTNTLGKHMRPA